MLNYSYYQIYMSEIPNEISLGIVVLGCDIHCPDCHSPHTWDINCQGQGYSLTYASLSKIIDIQRYMTCILFFGGEWKSNFLLDILKQLKNNYSYKLALYTGRKLLYIHKLGLLPYLDYIKVGAYDKLKGSLIYPSTNQRLYKLINGQIDKDITSLFWKTRIT